MSNSKLRYPIAVDMSDDHLYAAQLKGTPDRPMVSALAHRKCSWDLEERGPGRDDLGRVLKGILKDRRFSGRKVVLHPPSRNISSFHIRIRVENSEGIEEAILRKSEEYISFPLKEAIIDYPSLIPVPGDEGGEHGEYKVSITAIHRGYIDQVLTVFKGAGMVVEAVDFDVSSLIRLHKTLYQIPEKPVFLCNIGETHSIMSIIKNNGILAERHVSWGFNPLVGKVRSNLEFPEDEYKTEWLLHRYGLSFHEAGEKAPAEITEDEIAYGMRRAIYQITMPYIEELVDEFHRMTAYLRSEESEAFIEEIYLYGCASLIHGLDHYLEKRLNIPVSLVNPLTTFTLREEGLLPDRSMGSRFGLALGLALRRVPWF